MQSKSSPQASAEVLNLVADEDVSIASAFNALSGGVTGYVYKPGSAADQRTSIVEMSYLLRCAFSVRATDIDPIPLQLDSDFEAASIYIADQLEKWATGTSFTALFDAAMISDAHGKKLQSVLPNAVSVNDAAIWLCREFGHLRTTRDAKHCRRYIATWLTAQIVGDVGSAAASNADKVDALQERIDTWASPIVSIEQALHFERVIQPMLRRIAELGRDFEQNPSLAANDNGA